MKIVLSTRYLRFRAFHRHGRQGVFYEFFVTDPPRGLPTMGGSIQRTRWIVG